MFVRTRRVLAALATLATLLSAPLAQAQTWEGTPAFSNRPLVLQEGPGSIYAVTGEIDADIAVRVYRCQRLWCVVEAQGQRGWTAKHHINFGMNSQDWLGRISPDYPEGGTICLYEGTHYTGRSFCASTGQVFDDLKLWGWDNAISSIEVQGTSAAICRDRKFQSYCERIIESQPVLDEFLNNNLTSVRVY